MTILGKLLNPGSHPARKVRTKPTRVFSNAVAGSVSGIYSRLQGYLAKYDEISVRIQKQWVTLFIAALVLLLIIAGLSLNISSKQAITGREIQDLQYQISTNQRINADLETNIATLLSSSILDQRVKDLGYVAVNLKDIKYINVPGYTPADGANLEAKVTTPPEAELPAEYTESLFSWAARELATASLPLTNTH